MILGFAVVMCVLAFSATAALAHDFTASIVGKELSEATPGKIKGAGVGPQTFKFGPLKIACATAKTKGLATASVSQTLKIVATYKGCEAEVKVGLEPAMLKASFKTPVEYNFHANGFAETGTEGEEGSAEIGGGAAEVKVSGIKCIVSWPAQTVPIHAIGKPELEYTAAIFSGTEVANTHLKAFPSGYQHDLQISTEFKNMEFDFEEGQCSEFRHPEAKSGSYAGVLHEELGGGNLGWE
jgi:hypothetical protein